MQKVAFLFHKGRKTLASDVASDKSSDVPFYGMNHAAKLLGSEVSSDFLEFSGALKTLRRLRKYDVVVSSIGLQIFLLQIIALRKKPRWIFLNINMTSVLSNYHRFSLKRFVILFLLKRMHKVLCLSGDQKEYLIRLGVAPSRIEVVLYGTDKRFFSPSSHFESYILSVGKDQARDYRTLLAAAASLPAQFIVVASRRNIEGEGIRDVPDNVQIQYDLDFTHVRPLFENALFVVVPVKGDRSQDGSDCSGQTVVLDALACGKAVVVSRRAWVNDYLVPGEHALIVEPEDSIALASGMRTLLEDLPLRERIGTAGRKLVDEKCNTERMGQRIAGIIADALALLR
jgi:glycosyltransferase involved in cell wall biosynthesis